jgi:hypothetical protein
MWTILIIVVISILVLAIAVIASLFWLIPAILKTQRLDNMFDFQLSPDFFNAPPHGHERFVNSGRLPMSRNTMGDAYRWHDPKFFWPGDQFCKTFENGPWKWETQQRYAGKHLNCGHYFAATAEGATAEADYYGLDRSKLKLLKINGTADAVLDLTHEDNLIEVSQRAIKNFELIDERAYLPTVLSWLIDETEPGGNALTNYLGFWAQREGYDGILFFGARAFKSFPEFHDWITHGNEESFGQNIAYDYFHRMRRSYDLMNIVYFSSCFVKNIRRYAFPADGPWSENPFYGLPEHEIDQKLAYGREFQQQRGRFTLVPTELHYLR